MDLFAQLLLSGIANGSHYAMLAIGFGLIFSTTRVTHFAYGPLYALSAYLFWFFATALHWPLAGAIVVGILLSAFIGTLTYRFIYQPFQASNSSDLVILIASLGLFIIIENLVGIVFGTGSRVLDDVAADIYLLGPVVLTSTQVWQVLMLVLTSLLLALFLHASRFGKAIRAMADNPEMARIVGIDTRRVSLVVFALGTAIAAAPALLILVKDGASPYMGFHAVFMAFIAVVVGGVGSLRGAVLGGLILGLAEGIGLIRIPTEWQSSIAFVVLFIVMLVRPQGLFGRILR
ncbi:branched-chain amino acid ABC transporter permease [Castellaniella sp.]|uniref:branched-chain amino acid ABC transporter permease n=1 Tax=Castellaniella sp. TaxID=1955812 RepID=UPI00355DF08E